MKIEIKRMILIIGIMILAVLAGTILYNHNNQGVFTVERWEEYPNKRIQIVNDLLLKYDLKSMSKEEIISLLGKPSKTTGNFEISYFLGLDGTQIDDMMLDIRTNKEGKVEEYAINQH